MRASRVISFPSKEGVPCGYQHAISWQAIDRSEERKLSRVQVCSRCATLSVRSSGRREHGQSYHKLPFHGNHFLHEDTPPKADRNSLTKATANTDLDPYYICLWKKQQHLSSGTLLVVAPPLFVLDADTFDRENLPPQTARNSADFELA